MRYDTIVYMGIPLTLLLPLLENNPPPQPRSKKTAEVFGGEAWFTYTVHTPFVWTRLFKLMAAIGDGD